MMKKLAFVLLALILAGCNIPTEVPGIPPTATDVPATETMVPRPSETELPPPDTATPVLDDAGPVQPARIILQEPGQGSRIASAVVRGWAEPTFEQHLGIQITGEDGTLVGQGYATINAEIGTSGPFEAEIFFSVEREQSGRVAVFDTSARDGGLLYLTSVWVTLLPDAAAGVEILPGEPRDAYFQIDQPAAFGEVGGGMVHVEGMSGPAFENTILVSLCGEGGIGDPDPICGTLDNVLLTVPVTIQAPDIGQPGSFSVDLPYAVSQETFARVAVYTLSLMDGKVLELNSVEVLLLP